MNLGSIIKEYRKKKGLSIEELGEKVGRSKATVQKYETNSIDMTYSTLVKIQKILTIPPVLLFDIPMDIESNEKIKVSSNSTSMSLESINTKVLLEYLKQGEFLCNHISSDHIIELNILESIYKKELADIEEELKNQTSKNNSLNKKLSNYSNIIDQQNRLISKLKLSLDNL